MSRFITLLLSFIWSALLSVPFISSERVHAEMNAAYTFTFTAENGSCTITGITNAEPEIIIPDSLDGNQVTAIAEKAFLNDTVTEEVTLPETVVKIGNRAFCGCTNLKRINIPSGVEVIEHNTFNGCTSLNGITVPAHVKRIKTGAFLNCTALADIEIQSDFDMIGADALSGTAWLAQQKDGYVYFGNVLYGYKGEMPEKDILTVDRRATCIAECAFANCTDLAGVVFHDGIQKIGWGAFQNTGIKRLALPEISVIEQSAFEHCIYLKEIRIPDSVSDIGEHAFDNCPLLHDIVFGNCKDCHIRTFAFFNCTALKTVRLPSGVAEIEPYAFGYRDYGINGRGMIMDPVAGFEIQGCKESAAETYAAENGFTFTPISDDQIFNRVHSGDINNDGVCDRSDAVLLQKWLLGNPETQLSDWRAADMNADGKLNAVDLGIMKNKLI